ncbi:PilZ domain-containing protein [Bdellovibrio sp. HCB209]|uniref:PilZ domain-containing protein n=1 Tax=Bdellovibrio sp. HCB209 TaxID=3394354 RepID=UPI0039B45CD6
MQKSLREQRTVLSLVSSKTLSHFETVFRGCLLRQCHSLEGLKLQLAQNQKVVVLAEFDYCTSRHVKAFMSLKGRMRLIVIAKSIDVSVYQKYARHPDLLLIPKSDILQAFFLTSKFFDGDPVYMRSAVRQETSAPALVKSTNWVSQDSIRQRKGRFMDFAKQGARLYLPERMFGLKEFVSVLYQLENQEWVTVECQLRWEVATPDGGQIMGVQFLAIA